MRHTRSFLITLCAFGLVALLFLLALAHVRLTKASASSTVPQQTAAAGGGGAVAQDANKLVYADFENVQDKRPLSNRGGLVQLISYEERSTLPSRYKGLADSNPPAPEVVHLKQDDPNRAVAFDYELQGPNQYAGVGMEVHGHADKDGKPVADDVSEYKYLELQVYEKGVPSLRIEFISRGQGMSMSSGFPQAIFKVKEGFNTYRIPLKQLAQPSWAETKVSTKDVLKKLTSVNLVAYCEQCTPVKGTVVVDNMVFVK